MNYQLSGAIMIVALLAGCNGSQKETVQKELSHVRIVTMLHAKASSQLGRPPKDEQEFKQAISTSNVSLQSLKVNSVDEIFVSDRDGQPLVVVYGSPKASDVVVYEQTGVDGKRLVGHSIGMVEEVDEARFRELVPTAP
jgi:hypothetical protein